MQSGMKAAGRTPGTPQTLGAVPRNGIHVSSHRRARSGRVGCRGPKGPREGRPRRAPEPQAGACTQVHGPRESSTSQHLLGGIQYPQPRRERSQTSRAQTLLSRPGLQRAFTSGFADSSRFRISRPCLHPLPPAPIQMLAHKLPVSSLSFYHMKVNNFFS